MSRLLALIMDSSALLAAPLDADSHQHDGLDAASASLPPNSSIPPILLAIADNVRHDPDFTTVDSVVVSLSTGPAAAPPGSPTSSGDNQLPGGGGSASSGNAQAPGGPLAQLGRRGRGDANPDGPLPSATQRKRVTAAQLTLRSWVLGELLPPWMRLWAAQLAALAVAVQAEAMGDAADAVRAARAANHPPTAANHHNRPHSPSSSAAAASKAAPSAEAARYQLMRAGLEWLTRVVAGAGPVCSALLAQHALQLSPAGAAGRQAGGQLVDPALATAARAARQLVSVLLAVDVVPQLRFQVCNSVPSFFPLPLPPFLSPFCSLSRLSFGMARERSRKNVAWTLEGAQVQLEARRLATPGVPDGQAGVMRAVAALLQAVAALPGSARAALARAALEQGLTSALAALHDEQRRLGGRAAAAAATMDALQVKGEKKGDPRPQACGVCMCSDASAGPDPSYRAHQMSGGRGEEGWAVHLWAWRVAREIVHSHSCIVGGLQVVGRAAEEALRGAARVGAPAAGDVKAAALAAASQVRRENSSTLQRARPTAGGCRSQGVIPFWC